MTSPHRGRSGRERRAWWRSVVRVRRVRSTRRGGESAPASAGGAVYGRLLGWPKKASTSTKANPSPNASMLSQFRHQTLTMGFCTPDFTSVSPHSRFSVHSIAGEFDLSRHSLCCANSFGPGRFTPFRITPLAGWPTDQCTLIQSLSHLMRSVRQLVLTGCVPF